jgi:phage terminase small subunit
MSVANEGLTKKRRPMAEGPLGRDRADRDRSMLTPRQQRFVEEYLVDLNATQAAIRAGYSRKTAQEQSSRLLLNVMVAAAVATAQAKRSERTAVTADLVLAELAKLGFANMADYMKAGPDGEPYLDFASLTRDQAAALQEVTVETFMVAGEDREDLEDQPHGGALRRPAGREVRRVKFKLADKRAALVDIGRHLGMFKDRVEHTGKDGKDLIPPEVAPSKVALALLAVLRGGEATEGR